MIYKIVKACDTEKLTTQVQRLLEDGWQLQGGMVVDPVLIYYQTMVISYESMGRYNANQR